MPSENFYFGFLEKVPSYYRSELIEVPIFCGALSKLKIIED